MLGEVVLRCVHIPVEMDDDKTNRLFVPEGSVPVCFLVHHDTLTFVRKETQLHPMVPLFVKRLTIHEGYCFRLLSSIYVLVGVNTRIVHGNEAYSDLKNANKIAANLNIEDAEAVTVLMLTVRSKKNN